LIFNLLLLFLLLLPFVLPFAFYVAVLPIAVCLRGSGDGDDSSHQTDYYHNSVYYSPVCMAVVSRYDCQLLLHALRHENTVRVMYQLSLQVVNCKGKGCTSSSFGSADFCN
jgi:hypothetical protein